jgi:hypothetical protein
MDSRSRMALTQRKSIFCANFIFIYYAYNVLSMLCIKVKINEVPYYPYYYLNDAAKKTILFRGSFRTVL